MQEYAKNITPATDVIYFFSICEKKNIAFKSWNRAKKQANVLKKVYEEVRKLGGCYPRNILLDLHNSSHHTQRHLIILNYI